MDYVLGIDIGTQGTKAALFSEDGQCIAQAFQNSNLIKDSDGTIQEDPEEQFDAVCKTIKECVDQSKIESSSISALAIDGQMAGIIGVGKDGKNVTPYDSWLDSRCTKYIEKMQREAGEEVLEKSGHYPSINHGPKILWWKHEQPDVYKRIHSFVQPGGYAAMRLCGLRAADAYIDNTYLHFSGFANIKDDSWDDDICKRFDLEKEKLPRIVNPEDKIGAVIHDMASRTGLLEGTPVIAGCGDTAASFLSTGATQAGICVDVAGTASVFATTTNEFLPDKKHKTLGCGRAVTKGLWHPYAYINGGGMNIEWFLREIANRGNIQSASASAPASDITLDDLNQLISTLKTEENDPIFIPHMGGRVCPGQPNLRGAWTGLSWQHSLAHMYKAVLEGVALEYALYMNILKEGSKDFSPSEIRIIGGGSKSREWNQIKAEKYREAVEFIKNDELSLGALVTTHKMDLLRECKDQFDELDEYAELMDEISSISKRDGKLIGHAKDPITSGLSLDAFLPENYWKDTGAEAFIIGAGGSGSAISWHMMKKEFGENRPSKIIVANRSEGRIHKIKELHRKIGADIPVEYYSTIHNSGINQDLCEKLKPGSLVINATGLGKDAQGSPFTDQDVSFPRNGIAWDFNYRGDLVFLDQARKAKKKDGTLQIEDGWIYFIHGWTHVIAEVFDIDIPAKGPVFDALSKIAASVR